MEKITKQRLKAGSIVKIPVDSEWHTYGRILGASIVAFYDCRSTSDTPVDFIISSPILFKLPVMKYAISSGRWKIVGYVPLTNDLIEEPTFFKQDPISPSRYYLYKGGQESPAPKEQCVGLERAAVWDPEHCEDRLRDHYAGKVNKWVESLKIRD